MTDGGPSDRAPAAPTGHGPGRRGFPPDGARASPDGGARDRPPSDGPPGDDQAAVRPPHPPSRRVHLLFLALLALLAAVLATSEMDGASDRRAADGLETVGLDVEPARRETERRLLDLERRCGDLAAEALRRTTGLTDPAELFTALEGLDLPAAAGVQVEDRHGRLLAWTGTSVEEQRLSLTPFVGDGAVLLETPTSHRLAAQRTRTTVQDDAVARAICHLPFRVSYPRRNRFFTSWSLLDEVRDGHRVDAVTVFPPGEAVTRGTPLASAWGGEFARIDVLPLSAKAWVEQVDATLAKRRSWVFVAAAFAGAAWAWIAARGLGARRPAAAALVRAATVAALRLGLAAAPATSLVRGTPVTDPGSYSHSLPLALAASPLDLLLSCGALLWISDCVRRAAQASRMRATTTAGTIVGAAAVAVAASTARSGLGALVADVVGNSTVEFFPDVTVLPQAAAAALFGSVLAAGVAAVLLVAATWTWLGPADVPARAKLVVASVVVAALVAPSGPGATAADAALAVTATAGFAVALAAMTFATGTAVRAFAVPLAVAVGMFPSLESHVAEAVRQNVERQARERIEESDRTGRILVAATLSRLADSPELAQALRDRRLPRDLRLRLWEASPLASRPGGSAIEIEPRDPTMDRVRHSVNLPPLQWLPAPSTLPPIDEIAAVPLPGRGPGRDGRWLVGSRRILVDGRHAATAWVTLEVQTPSNPGISELEVLGPEGGERRRVPTVAVTRYDGDGSLAETNDAYRAAGVPLAPAIREEVVGSEGPVWLTADVAGRSLAAVVVPQISDGAITAYWAFSFDTGGVRRMALRGARAVLCGALAGAAAIVLTIRRWVRGPRLRLAHRLVLSYVVVSGVPLLLLGWANLELPRQRADEAALRELREAASRLEAFIEEQGTDPAMLRILELPDVAREERLRNYAYGAGHQANVFHGPSLLGSSDQGLYDTDLLPRRLPGPVHREIILLGRPFHAFPARVGSETFDVGFAPVRTNEGEVVGAVSVPLLRQRRLREADLADGVTAILALYLASLVAAVAVGTWLAARLTLPLRDLTTATHRVAAGDLSRPVPAAGPGELGEVVGAFNRMMRDLAESRERLVRAEKEAAWRDMARQVAHEVKNPLTPMRLAAEHLRRAWRDGVPNFGDMLERSVDLIVRQTESLKRIATAFSDFARLPGRRRDPTDVADVARRVVQLYENTPNLTLTAELAPGLPAILADPDELHRVLVNLAKNAVEAMEGRSGRLSLRLRREGDELVLDVEDDGPGIPDDVRARLFEPYFSTKTAGTGLGLAICKRAIEDLGGSIAVRSAAGRGTTFTVRIPVTTRPAT